MLRHSFFILSVVAVLSACSTDYSDNGILAGTQRIGYSLTLPASQQQCVCPLRERSPWQVARTAGEGLRLSAMRGEADDPLVVDFDAKAEGTATIEVRHATGTTETVSIVRTAEGEAVTLRVLQFNVWQEGTMVDGGYEAIVGEIARLQPDFVTLSEVRNYSGTDFTARLVKSLEKFGLRYTSSRSDDTGLLSRHGMAAFSNVTDDNGTVNKLVTTVAGRRIAVYTAHLDYTHYACYYPRGYDGTSWAKLDASVTDIDAIQKMNLASSRDEEIAAFIADADVERERGTLVLLGGDFNEPSHLDWTYDTRQLYDHHGVVYNWDTSMALQNAGYVDSYRHLFPSAVTHPGFTYPSDNLKASVSKLSWAPEADERERIDFIYYGPDVRWTVTSAAIVGPRGSIVRGQRVTEQTNDTFITPQATWPSDHKALLIEMTIARE